MQINRVFGECLVHSGLRERSGVATATVLRNAFACMRARLEDANTSSAHQAAVTGAIARAIQDDPSLKDDEKTELQNVLRSAFADSPYTPTEPAMRSFKIGFLSRVTF